MVRTWNTTNQIRPRPLAMGRVEDALFTMPQLYGAEDKLQPVLEEELDVCKEECTPKGQYPCNETVFELCTLITDENGWDALLDAYTAAELYSKLRQEILENL